MMTQSVLLELIVRMVHFLGILGLVGALVTQNFMLKSKLPSDQLKRLAMVDSLYGGSALVVLVAGLSLWLFVGKPTAFYSANPVFMLKLTLFVCVALISLYPTFFLLRNRKQQGGELTIPRSIVRIKRLELLAVAVMPILAVFMARGVGLGG